MGLIVPEGVEKSYLAQRSEPRSAEAYAAACVFDFEAMKPYLIPGDVLDIGCGLGGVTSLVAKHCGGALHVLDGDSFTNGRRVDYGATMEPYNDRQATEKMLTANGIEAWTWWPIGAKALPSVQNCISTISYGWHYSVGVYFDALCKALEPGARLILDLRPGKGGEQVLEEAFEFIAKYQGFGKCNKTVWQRRA